MKKKISINIEKVNFKKNEKNKRGRENKTFDEQKSFRPPVRNLLLPINSFCNLFPGFSKSLFEIMCF